MSVKFEKTGDSQYTLDVTGFTCPHPQMYTKKALQKISDGESLSLCFDNPSSGEAIRSMCEGEGHRVEEKEEQDGSFVWEIVKGA